MIKLKHLTHRYDSKIVLNQIEHVFASSKIHGIVGLNGSGKTTLFNLLAKVIKPSEGEVFFNDAPLHISDSTYLETSNYFYSNINGHEYLRIFSQTNAQFDVEKLQVYLQLPLNEMIENYSTGMKKKLALLAMLKRDTPIYILDEPFNGLDLETNKVLEIILETLVAKGKTIFISSHILEPLLAICHEIHHLQEGQFIKVYQQQDFAKLDAELFAKFKLEVINNIRHSV